MTDEQTHEQQFFEWRGQLHIDMTPRSKRKGNVLPDDW